MSIGTAGGSVVNCILDSNGCWGYGSAGGAIYMASFDGLIDRCVFTGNNCNTYSSGNGGNAVYLNAGTMRNCLVVGNGASGGGGKGGSVLAVGGTVESCSFYGNRDSAVSGVRAEGTAKIVNCILGGGSGSKVDADNYFKGTASCFVTNVCPIEIAGGIGCVVTNSIFRNAAEGDYYPGDGALDAAHAFDWMEDGTDLAGTNRVMGVGPDFGCYEMPVSFAKVTADVTEGLAPVTVTYTVTIKRPTLSGITCEWDWNGDGSWDETTEGSTTHIFKAGNYNVRVKVTDIATGEVYEPDVPFVMKSVPSVLYVAPSAAHSAAPYDTWDKAATRLSDAVSASIDGCEIIVSNGTYALTGGITLEKSVTIRGFGGNPTNVTLNYTSGRHFSLDNAAAKLEALTLRGGEPSSDAGGVNIGSRGGSIINCIIDKSGCWGYGAAGGGVRMESADGLIDRCVFTGNKCGTYTSNMGGNAVYLSAGTMRNCLVVGNGNTGSTHGLAGTVYAVGGTVENCTFYGNMDTAVPGVRADVGAEIVNCLICSNYCATGQSEACVYAGEASSFSHCLSDVVKINNDCFTCQVGDVFMDPATLDFRLPATSPAVNKGVWRNWMDGATDIAGIPRKIGKNPDIGCYECTKAGGFTLIVR